MRAWKTKQSDTQALALKETLPESLVALMKGLWAGLLEESEAKILILQQQVEHYQRDAHQKIQTLQAENAQLQQEFQHVKREKETLAQEKHVLEALLTSLHTEKNTLETQHHGLLQQMDTQQKHITELHRLHQQTQTNLEHYREAAREQRLLDQNQHEQQQKALEYTILELRQTFSMLSEAHQEKQQELTQLQHEKANFLQQLDELSHRHDHLQLQFTEAQQTIQKNSHWEIQYQHLQNKEIQLNAMILESEKRVAMLCEKLTLVEKDLCNVKDQNHLLAHEKWSLGQEKAQLQGQLKQLEKNY